MFENPFLILSAELSLAELREVLTNVSEYLRKSLTVQFHSNHRTALPQLSPAILDIYSICDKMLPSIDVRLNVESVRVGKWLSGQPDALLLAGIPNTTLDLLISQYGTCNVLNLLATTPVAWAIVSSEELVDTTVLGGTFDRIHLGHKCMLVEAVIRARRRVVVGVTDETMVKGKKLPELILPVAERIRNVQNFLKSFDATLQYDVVPISDPFGPTATDPDMDLIVVSQETLRGGQKVNELRAEKGLRELKVHVINLIEHDEHENPNFEKKVSSSNRRLELLGTLLRPPYHKNEPYMIGVTGGPQSGKTTVANMLKELVGLEKVTIMDGNVDGCNEIWLCSVSPDIQKLRIGEGADLKFEPTCEPNVVISSSFDFDCMRGQVKKAWEGLKFRLKAS